MHRKFFFLPSDELRSHTNARPVRRATRFWKLQTLYRDVEKKSELEKAPKRQDVQGGCSAS